MTKPFLLCCCLLLALGLAAPTWASRFPDVELSPLSGSSALTFSPSSRSGPVFVALGFHPRHQASLETGMRQADTLRAKHPALRVVEIPVIEPNYQRFRKPIQDFMRQQVKYKPYLTAVYPWYTPAAGLKQQLKLPASTEWVFLLCDSHGQVQWQHPGPLTPAQLDTLQRRLSGAH